MTEENRPEEAEKENTEPNPTDTEELTDEAEQEALIGKGEEPSYYVGVGASAGGLEALETFFENMAQHSGLAFIVVQHLSPQYKSLMVELLSKRTMMRVVRVEDGMEVEADTVYLIPPKKNLTLFHGKLLLSEQDHSQGVNLPIDVFFRSLAEDKGEKAVGIILSGTGSDGMRGVRAIKEAGGMVMVQDEESAKFDGMPRSAISTGLTDFILAPDKMPSVLLKFIHHPYMSKAERSENFVTDEDKLARVFSLLRDKAGVDFTYYKPSTVIRRIERRMTINQIEDLGAYVKHLEKFPHETMALYRELLIGVTNFFRDAQSFETILEKILPSIFDEAQNRDIRFWVAGCSTGEEAYSMAILCREYMDKIKQDFDVKIFATDIDRNAIEKAGNGVYPESIAADLSADRLQRFFLKKGDNYQVNRSLREMVIFAPHNILKDPPFTRIDLLSCRNLLIYLQPVLQKKALSLFHFSLKQEGFLFLGTSETVGDLTEQFELLDSKWKLYRSKLGAKPPLAESFIQPMPSGQARRPRAISGQAPSIRTIEEERIFERLLNVMTDYYIPAGIIANENMEVVHVLGGVEEYFRLAPGRLTNDVVKMARKDLAIPLATGIQKAFKTRQEVVYTNIRLTPEEEGGVKRLITLRVVPFPEKRGHENLVGIFLEDNQTVTKSRPDEVPQVYDVDKEAQQRIADLEQELQYTKENLQATIEELETSNEELQATNEELLASNEEMQSTNEELQSTNEELQSVNEELYTVNAEYQSKILELTDLNNDIDNLLRSSEVGTLFLDQQLMIRKFTPAVTEVLTIMNQDIGRPIHHLSHELVGTNLMEVIREVQEKEIVIEREVQNTDGKWFLLRALPYRINQDQINGIVLTFIDISNLKSAENRLQKEQDLLENITETSQVGVLIFDISGNITFHNPMAEHILQVEKGKLKSLTYDHENWTVTDLEGNSVVPKDFPFPKVLETKKPLYGSRFKVQYRDNPPVPITVNSRPVLNDEGEVDSVIQTIGRLEDETQQN